MAQVTDNKSLSKKERKRLQLKHAETVTLEAGLVKLADKWDNCRDLQRRPAQRMDGTGCGILCILVLQDLQNYCNAI